jgi:hypothetical protein
MKDNDRSNHKTVLCVCQPAKSRGRWSVWIDTDRVKEAASLGEALAWSTLAARSIAKAGRGVEIHLEQLGGEWDLVPFAEATVP